MRDAIIVALLFFLVMSWNYQPYMDAINGARLQYIQAEANTAIDEGKIKGYFSSSDLQTITQDVSSVLGYPVADVSVSGTQAPQTFGNPVWIKISIPTHLNMFSMASSTNTTTLVGSAVANSEALD